MRWQNLKADSPEHCIQALIKDSDSEFWIAHREEQELFQIAC
ncbi:MAG: hypothetical protein ACLS36_08370 [Streptococcus sp.]